MSSNFDFVESLLAYVRKKAKNFLKEYNLDNAYDQIEQSANENSASLSDYINKLLNETVSKVSEVTNKDWNTIREDFNSHYLSEN